MKAYYLADKSVIHLNKDCLTLSRSKKIILIGDYETLKKEKRTCKMCKKNITYNKSSKEIILP